MSKMSVSLGFEPSVAIRSKKSNPAAAVLKGHRFKEKWMQSPGRLVHVGFKTVMSILGHEPAQWIVLLMRGVSGCERIEVS